MKRVLLLLLGAAAVLPLVAVDPALLVLLFDADLLALLGAVGVTMTREDARLFLGRVGGAVASSLPVLEVRAGWRISREDPRSLLVG